MPSPGSIATSSATLARSAVTGADNSTINDTNFPPDDDYVIDCTGWKSVIIIPRFVAGTGPTVAVQPLHRAAQDPAPDPAPASGWAVDAAGAAIAEGKAQVVNVMGRKTYFRVDALTGTPTNVSLLVAGWEPFRNDGPSRG